MEPLYNPAETVIQDDGNEENEKGGIEEFITSDVILGLLGIPEQGLLRISAALLIAGNNEVCAYWWRDPYTGKQTAELRDPVQVRAAFSNTVIDSGYLPPNVIRLGVGNGVQWMSVYLPPASYQVTLLDGQNEPNPISIGLPGLIFTGCGNKYWMWAVKDRQISPVTQVYHVPLPNIGEDGTLCFGMNTPPNVDGPTIMQAFYLFLDSPFNDHWAIGKSLSHPGDVRLHLKTLATLEEPPMFPDDDLLPITPTNAPDHYLTLDHLFKHALRR
jgi:hypothetical protein